MCGSQQNCCEKFLKRIPEYQTTWPVLWETCMWVKKQELELDMEQLTGSKLEKDYVRSVYCNPVYLTYMHSTSCKMPARWITSWNQDCPEKYQQPQICRYHSNGRKWRGTKEPLDEGERGEWKSWLEIQHSKTKTTASSPIISGQIEGGKVETDTDFIFLGSKINSDSDCNYEIKRHLLLGRKAMKNLDSIIKSRDIILPTKVHMVKWFFPLAICGCESWTIKKAEHWRTDAFELWYWRRLLRVPWTARKSNQS